ncbi:MAG: exonuclease [Candidatus Bathyarchaeota archaeon]|nr:MAG: exonuclease [Candidatus Bathyarchaeota archaeon]
MESFLKANVTDKGAILLGSQVACDAFEETRPLRVVTHAHADHLTGLHRSLKMCDAVVMTPATRDLISVLKGPDYLLNGNVKAINYGSPLIFNHERLILFRVDHILGAAQVLVEDAEGTRILYTGDFRFTDTPVVQSDVLVIEATYGNPWRTRNFEDEAKQALVSMVEKGLEQGPVYVFGYHGKLQEVMQILHKARIKVPFIMPEKIRRISEVHQNHGVILHRPLYSAKREMQSTLHGGGKYVAFYHMSWRKKVGLNKFRICVSGWEFNSPCRQLSNNEYIVALSDHSDFNGLLEYVQRSNPKLVITDNYRAGYGTSLAEQIEKRLGIQAKALPIRTKKYNS